ncbi:23 kDa integral membrane protein isoform X1 [Drosophila virilis]|uniref:23 kDa integral membrane protein isoform X1 n=2 Tax=Drosophila virilis TaxID=7244 RepID=UPI0013964063|nr:23 kDa integral membrane protein isoform X1 [Drosophila virilis]XP_032290951.1 23 kDa integral membrane protein isoform X1 [Drosophila virilis]
MANKAGPSRRAASLDYDGLDKRNWKLIASRWVILILAISCIYANINDIMYYSGIINQYSQIPECGFVKFEIMVVVSGILMLITLTVGGALVLKQQLRQLRAYLTFLFIFSWMHLMIILVLTQRYPLVHEIHSKWIKRESINMYEIMYNCCGVFGPDDYLLLYGKLPSSCFSDSTMESKDLYYTGCLNKNDIESTIVRGEMVTSLIQFIFCILLMCFYFFIKQIKAPQRSLRDLWKDRIIL